MASTNSAVDQYKMNSEIIGTSVTHPNHNPNSRRGRPPIEGFTTWDHEKTLGTGGFGEVSLQRERISGNLRAVKAVLRSQLRPHEMETLITLQDVCIPLLDV